MNRPFFLRAIAVLIAISAAYLIGYVGFWRWTVCRVEVPPGQSLLLRYKGPFPFALREVPKVEGTLVKLDAKGRPVGVGILEAMPGPGRHFYSPLEYEHELVPDILIDPGQLGVVVAKLGKSLPAGTYLVDREGDQGIWRRVLTPGRYRLNKYAYDVKVVGVAACIAPRTATVRPEGDPTLIPAGYVGVVTNKTDNPAIGQVQGIQDEVLQPGLYFLNPEEKQVDVVSVGFNEASLTSQSDKTSRTDLTRDPVYVPNTGLEFPSNDGFPIHLDYTAIWGIVPEQAPDVVRRFGMLKDVEQKVILPQIGSICRLFGSKRGAIDLLVGESRERFQDETTAELEKVLASKDLTLLFGLTRHIDVPVQVRGPIQKAKIADELTLTREQERLTAEAQADLTEAKAKVTLEKRRTAAETGKLAAQVVANGEKKAREIEANTERLRAEVDAKTAIVEAQVTKALGEANAQTAELANQAKADLYVRSVHALGGGDAYNRYQFAEGLPDDLRLGVFYAGPGTFWTDLKGFEQTMLGKLANESINPATTRPTANASRKP